MCSDCEGRGQYEQLLAILYIIAKYPFVVKVKESGKKVSTLIKYVLNKCSVSK